MFPTDPATPASASRALRIALAIVRTTSLIVPGSVRRGWRAEWRAELIAEEGHAAAGSEPGPRGTLVRKALGSLPDALYMVGRGFEPGTLTKDVRLALRALASRPGFTVTAVVTLALGVGVNTALFSLVRGVLLRPLPYHEPHRLVQLEGHRVGRAAGSGNVSYPNLHDLNAEVGSLEAVVALSSWRPAFTGDDAEVVPGATVSWDYFQVLGVEPAAGRFFRAAEEGRGRAPAVVLSHGVWDRRYGRDPLIVGRGVEIDNASYTVIGVAPENFEGPHLITFEGKQPEIWRTPWFDASEAFRSGRSWKGLARIADGVGPVQAQADVSSAMAGLVERFPDDNAERTVTLTPLRESVVGQSRSALYLLFGAVLLVLLVTCVNVAALLVGRMLERRNELLVRGALGAPPGRLIMHLFSESAVIAGVGAALGILLAFASVDAIVSVAGAWLPRPEAVVVDGAVLTFSVALAAGTALLFGLLPAMSVVGGTRLSAATTARSGGSLGRRGAGARRAVVVGQIATTVLLVVGAGVLVQSLRHLYAVDLGIERDGVVTMDLHGAAWWELDPSEATSRYQAILEGVRSLPGVSAVGGIDVLPLADNHSCDGVTPLDRPPPAAGQGQCAEVRSITPGALEALGVRLVAGRSIDWGDDAESLRAVVITERASEVFWPGGNALGQQARIHGDTFTVVGIVGDIRHFGPESDIAPMAFLPAQQEGWNGVTRGLSLVVRGAPAVERMGPAVRDVVHEVDARIAVEAVQPLRRLLAARVSGPRLRALLLSAFALLALTVALVGLAGVMAQAVARRRRELGIRLALGSTPSAAMRLVMGDGGRMTLAGLAMGLLAAAAMTRFLRGFVHGVHPLDPTVLVLGSGLVLGLGLLASWLPARRAAAVDPVEALRED